MDDDTRTRRIWELSEIAVGACIEVHRHLGPGLLESAYETCVCYELETRGVTIERQRSLPVVYKDLHLDCAYRLDIVVEELLLLELKSVSELSPLHDAQVLTYLKVARIDVGLLINFNTRLLGDGIRRLVRFGATIGRPTR